MRLCSIQISLLIKIVETHALEVLVEAVLRGNVVCYSGLLICNFYPSKNEHGAFLAQPSALAQFQVSKCVILSCIIVPHLHRYQRSWTKVDLPPCSHYRFPLATNAADACHRPAHGPRPSPYTAHLRPALTAKGPVMRLPMPQAHSLNCIVTSI